MHGLMKTDKYKCVCVCVAVREWSNLFLRWCVDLDSVSGTLLSCCIALLEIKGNMLIFTGNQTE